MGNSPWTLNTVWGADFVRREGVREGDEGLREGRRERDREGGRWMECVTSPVTWAIVIKLLSGFPRSTGNLGLSVPVIEV